jgi:di/tricarboxylate transporter
VTDALRTAGLRPFGIFEFTPITAAIVVAGIVFMVLVGRLLPSRGAGQTLTGSPVASAIPTSSTAHLHHSDSDGVAP